jgi:transketolase
MRPALRLAAQLRSRVIFTFVQEEGADHLAEQLAALRALSALHVFRPADAVETAECWELALRHTDGPSLLVVSAKKCPALRGESAENRSARGGYVLAEAEGPRSATLIASGPELTVALAARAALARQGIPVAVVSLPCWALFGAQAPAIRAMTLGGALRVALEAGSAFGWERWIGRRGCFVGVGRGEASVAGRDLYKHATLTPDAIVAAVKRRLGARPAGARSEG